MSRAKGLSFAVIIIAGLVLFILISYLVGVLISDVKHKELSPNSKVDATVDYFALPCDTLKQKINDVLNFSDAWINRGSYAKSRDVVANTLLHIYELKRV